MKIKLFVSFISAIISLNAVAQKSPQLRLRFGASKSIVSAARSDNDTYFKMYDRRSPLPSGIGLEFAKPLKKKNTSLLLGAFLDIQTYSLGINPNRFIVSPGGGVYSSDNGSIKFYAGLEKRIGKKTIPKNKNYFSIFGGLAIAYNFPGYGPNDYWGGSIGDGTTKEGKIYQGIYRQSDVYTGYTTQIRPHSAHTITPDLFAGFRWNIRNKKENTALVVELGCNYGLMTKFYFDIPYTLDGQLNMDRLKDKGVNVHLNVLIPVKNFSKEKK